MNNNLKAWLSARGMTQAELAATLDMSRKTVNEVCNGAAPSGAFMWRFFKAFGMNETTAAFDPEALPA
jgi:transcriptional regulator with XRE-family HTH domain